MPSPPPPSTPKRKLRWYQFSLRTLLIFVTLFGIACSWFAVKMQQAKRQREATKAIILNGGSFGYDFEMPDQNDSEIWNSSFIHNLHGPGGIVESTPSSIPEWLIDIVGIDFFYNVVSVEVGPATPWKSVRELPHLRIIVFGWYTSDESLENLKDLPNVNEIILGGDGITDAGLEHLRGLNQLQILDMGNKNITDKGLDFIKDLKNLRILNLSCWPSKITDEGLIKLKGLSQLKQLDLTCVPITDTGMESLKDLSQLEVLWLNQTDISENGLRNIKGLTQLKYLSLNLGFLTDDSLKNLESLTKLKYLDLQGNIAITDAGIKHLKGLTRLQELGLLDIQVGEDGIKQLLGLAELKSLSMNASDAVLVYLKSFKKLEILRADSEQITDKGLNDLKKLNQLDQLWLYGTKISQAGFVELQKSLPKVYIQHN